MSVNRGVDKEDVVHMYNGILICHKKEQNYHDNTHVWSYILTHSQKYRAPDTLVTLMNLYVEFQVENV